MREPQRNYDERVMSPSPSLSSSSPSLSDENEELQRLEHAPPFWRNNSARRLSKQLSMCEPPREVAWERRRRQFLRQERSKNGINHEFTDNLTDDDLHELKGCIELGFGFNEVNGQRLCTTIPALDLYFAVNRQFYSSPVPSPGSAPSLVSSASTSSVSALGDRSSSFGSDSDWKICSPGDDPQHVKTKLRHWALAVACVLRQSS
ncbi:hypothetical protein ACS0TY_003028 [Phlomoides rotata]